MKKDNDWHNISTVDMLERLCSQNDVNITKPGDLAVRIGLLLLMPFFYVAWYMSYAQTPNRYPFF